MSDARRRQLTWLGQAGFRLDLGETSFVVDPWLSPHEDRLIPPPSTELAADGVDWLLVTHEHLDHLDLPFLPVLLERSPSARVVLPAPLEPLVAVVVPADRIVGVQPHDRIELDGVEIHAVPAVHGVTMEDAYGDGSAVGGRPRFVGYVLGGAGERIFHAGDTIPDPALSSALRALAPETVLLPINGRDDERHARGIVGNMDSAEAVDLALEVGAKLLVPYHWDGFAGNTVDPHGAVEASAGRVRVDVPERFVAVDL